MKPTQNHPPTADARFFNSKGENVQGWEAVVPICRWHGSGRIEAVGTGFFIEGQILVTAAHVIIDCNRSPLEGLFILHYVPTNRMLRRRIIKACVHLRADVAILALEMGKDPESGQVLGNKRLIMTKAQPAREEDIGTWAFPKSITSESGTQGVLEIRPKVYVGRILEEYTQGRDKVMLPGPCYETDLSLEGGASGGPVFDSRGRVFAVNSTGIGGTDVAYVSHIQAIGALSIEQFQTPDGIVHKQMSIGKMIDLGLIQLDVAGNLQ